MTVKAVVDHIAGARQRADVCDQLHRLVKIQIAYLQAFPRTVIDDAAVVEHDEVTAKIIVLQLLQKRLHASSGHDGKQIARLLPAFDRIQIFLDHLWLITQRAIIITSQ